MNNLSCWRVIKDVYVSGTSLMDNSPRKLLSKEMPKALSTVPRSALMGLCSVLALQGGLWQCFAQSVESLYDECNLEVACRMSPFLQTEKCVSLSLDLVAGSWPLTQQVGRQV